MGNHGLADFLLDLVELFEVEETEGQHIADAQAVDAVIQTVGLPSGELAAIDDSCVVIALGQQALGLAFLTAWCLPEPQVLDGCGAPDVLNFYWGTVSTLHCEGTGGSTWSIIVGSPVGANS